MRDRRTRSLHAMTFNCPRSRGSSRERRCSPAGKTERRLRSNACHADQCIGSHIYLYVLVLLYSHSIHISFTIVLIRSLKSYFVLFLPKINHWFSIWAYSCLTQGDHPVGVLQIQTRYPQERTLQSYCGRITVSNAVFIAGLDHVCLTMVRRQTGNRIRGSPLG
jgi:hypothetical protein